ncbi:MAG: phosphoglucosamine mutase [Chloroflexia bacterium]
MAEGGRLFGTDGIRGRVPGWPLTADLVVRLGQVAAEVLGEAGYAPLALIGRDTRRSGHMLEAAIAAGLMERGVDVASLGVLPTPAVALLARQLGAGLGVAISASHNPASDNGLKFFSGSGFKLPDALEEEIERRVLRGPPSGTRCPVGRSVTPDVSPEEVYLEALLSRAGRPRLLETWRLVLDCAHGAAYRVAPELFRRLGAQVIVLNASPDGENINADCGSEHPQGLREAVLRERADAGLALDGDGDRLLLVDERGALLDGDDLLAVLARDLLARGQLRHNTVVGTVMTNLGLEHTLEAWGARLERVPVGDRHIVRRMLEGDFVLGGEPSGHLLLFGEGITTGDGLYTAIKVLGLAVRTRRPLSALSVGVRKYPQVIVNVPAPRQPPLEALPEVREAQARVQERLGAKGRVLLRYSGTQPLLRVMVEGEDEEIVAWAADVLAEAAGRALAEGGSVSSTAGDAAMEPSE